MNSIQNQAIGSSRLLSQNHPNSNFGNTHIGREQTDNGVSNRSKQQYEECVASPQEDMEDSNYLD